jgi:leader peptidase (prepilin peptidase)/N-methyltransferase
VAESTLIAVGIFFLGAIIGSFLNVCIIRWPLEKSVVHPRSHCTQCKKTIPWYDNVPLLSYWILSGRCRFCKAKFSIRYFFVELFNALIYLAFYLHFGLTPVLWPYLFMMSAFLVATFVDFEHRIIPDEVSIGGMVIGIIFSLIIPQLHVAGASINFSIVHLQSLGLSLLGVLIGGGSIYAMGMLGDFMFKKESMGGGDVKLLAMIGAFLGWKLALLTFFVSPFFGAAYGIIEKVRTKDTTIAYGPFLVVGAVISLFYGDVLIERILTGQLLNGLFLQ